MATKNNITGDEIKSKALSAQGRENWDKIFGKKNTDNPISNKQMNKKVYLIGDTHGEWHILNQLINKYDIRDIHLIHVGDIGVGFKHPEKEKEIFEFQNTFFADRNIHFIGIRGNHDDPSYFGGELKLSNFELVPDYTYREINGETFLFVGGAVSIDRTLRVPYVSWWEDELLVLKLDLVKKADVLVTHSAPHWIGPFDKAGIDWYCQKDAPLWGECVQERKDIAELIKLAKPSRSYHGHFHITAQVDFDGCLARILNMHEMIEHFPRK